MNRIAELEAIVDQYNLNKHPFYQDWRAGTLPTEKMRDYSGEYGRFVATIASGWETLGESHYAAEEREHEVLWSDFQFGVGLTSLVNNGQTQVLETAAVSLFATMPEAVGALFAFEAQQPYTSQSKLDGLNEHYSVSDVAKKYFRVHANDISEVEDLKRYAQQLRDPEFARAKGACAVVCAAMWSALDGVYYS